MNMNWDGLIKAGKLLAFGTLVGVLISGCSGSSSSSSGAAPSAVKISGTAAAGAPIVGKVTAKDSKGVSFGPATIGADGSYSVIVTNGVAPFIMQASGVVGATTIEVYSVANDPAAANLNINPLTNMVVAQATGVSPATVFSACSSSSCGTPVQTKVDLGQQQVQALLSALLAKFGVSGTINLLTDAIVAGPVASQSPIDKMMDVVNIKPVSGAPTSFEIKPNPVSGLSTSLVLVTVPAVPTGGVTTLATTALTVDAALTTTVVTNATAALTALQAIQTRMDVLTSLFATSKPAATDAKLVALFDNAMLDWGYNKTTFLAGLTSVNGPPVGSKWTNVVAASPRPLSTASVPNAPATLIANDATHQWVTFVYTAPNGNTGITGPVLAVNNGTNWVFAANQVPTPSFTGSYSSSNTMTGGWVHTESFTVSGTTFSGSHSFSNTDPAITATGSFTWTGGTISISSTDNKSGTISGGTVTIVNGTTRTATNPTGGFYVQEDGSVRMWWNATDPVNGGIGGCSSTKGVFWCA